MSVESEFDIEHPECSRCELEMEFVDAGTSKSVPVIGTEIEYQRYSCPECGQGARFERSGPEEEWSRAGV